MGTSGKVSARRLPDLEGLSRRHDIVELVFNTGRWVLVVGDCHYYGYDLQECAKEAEKRGVIIQWLTVTNA